MTLVTNSYFRKMGNSCSRLQNGLSEACSRIEKFCVECVNEVNPAQQSQDSDSSDNDSNVGDRDRGAGITISYIDCNHRDCFNEGCYYGCDNPCSSGGCDAYDCCGGDCGGDCGSDCTVA